MYVAESTRALLRRRSGRGATGARADVSRTVVLLGLTSMFTDISAEMVATILPVYVVFALGGTPLQLGIIDGLYQGAAAIIRVLAGIGADRRGRHKLFASIGYGLSAGCKLGFVAVGSALPGLASMVLLDRTGKAIRTAPRDAMISLSANANALGLAFGVHRALDTAGALVGPLLAVALLLAAPGDYDAVFLVSFFIALIGLAMLVLLVPPDATRRGGEQQAERAQSRRESFRGTARLLRERPYRRLVVVSSALALVTISDGFLFLALQHRMDFAPPLLPLLFVGSAFAYMLLAVPVGRLADRVGRGRVFVTGYLVLALAYTSLLMPTIGPLGLAIYLFMIGAFYAATDGVLAALGSSLLPEDRRAGGLSIIGAADSMMSLVSSVLFGALWTLAGFKAALVLFTAALLLAIGCAALTLVVRPARAGNAH